MTRLPSLRPMWLVSLMSGLVAIAINHQGFGSDARGHQTSLSCRTIKSSVLVWGWWLEVVAPKWMQCVLHTHVGCNQSDCRWLIYPIQLNPKSEIWGPRSEVWGLSSPVIQKRFSGGGDCSAPAPCELSGRSWIDARPGSTLLKKVPIQYHPHSYSTRLGDFHIGQRNRFAPKSRNNSFPFQ